MMLVIMKGDNGGGDNEWWLSGSDDCSHDDGGNDMVIITFFYFDCRIERMEMLDEVDLFYQLSSHYCISWAYNDEKHTGNYSFIYFVVFNMSYVLF